MSRLKLFIPLLVFLVLAGIFWFVLSEDGYDPQSLPSALLNKPVPAFSLPTVEGDRTVTDADIKGQPYLLNVWASWCITCRVEHRFLNELKSQGVRIIGIDYKDDRIKALKWIQDLGDPYTLNLFDADGRVGLDLGVYGAPETYFVDANGIIRYKHVGDINAANWKDELKAVYEKMGAAQ